MSSSRRDKKAVVAKTNCVAKRGRIMKRSELENNQRISAAELRGMNRPDLDVVNAKDFSSYTFWQYTSVDSIGKILRGSCFWVNNIAAMNDLHETELHKEEKQDIFVQCFCNSDSEKIPMWYLYGGIAGKGASFGFTPRVMLDYIRSITHVTELVFDPASGTYAAGERFAIGSDFELQVGWVFYADYELPVKPWGRDGNFVRVNYFNKFVNVEEAEQFFDSNYFVKDYPWEYEKEFRLVFINKTGRKIDKIKIDIPEAFRASKNRRLKIRLAPEISNSVDAASGLSGFERCAGELVRVAEKNSYQISVSKSKLKINMDLLGRSKGDVNEYIGRNPDYLDWSTVEKVYRRRSGDDLS